VETMIWLARFDLIYSTFRWWNLWQYISSERLDF
jgi:hypothetical protein